jgi:hypothetical protein
VEQWLYLLLHAGEEDEKMQVLIDQNEYFKKVLDRYKYFASDEQARLVYEARQKFLHEQTRLPILLMLRMRVGSWGWKREEKRKRRGRIPRKKEAKTGNCKQHERYGLLHSTDCAGYRSFCRRGGRIGRL